MLATQTFGEDGDKPPVLIAHGLFGSARNWGVIAKRLATDRRVITVDMRNHGSSPWTSTHSYADMASDLAAVLSEPVDVVGHSMGGKAAMTLALTRPEVVNRLVVVDIAPVAYEHTQMQNVKAMRTLDPAAFGLRSEADAALSDFVEDRATRAFLLQSLDLKYGRWKLNLDTLADEMAEIMGFPDLGGSWDGRSLFLSGAESDYVLPEHRARIKDLFPSAFLAKIPGVGHLLHAEKPREFEAAVRGFLDR